MKLNAVEKFLMNNPVRSFIQRNREAVMFEKLGGKTIGQKVLEIGCRRGIDIAKAALAAGYSVVATGRNTNKVAEAIGESAELLIVKLDITNPPKQRLRSRPLSIGLDA